MFDEWRISSGIYHSGEKAGKPIPLVNTERGKILILTTRYPEDSEEDRIIVGLYRIGKIQNDTEAGVWLEADPKYRIRLPMKEAMGLYFWDYHKTSAGAKWHTGLFRYLSDEVVLSILIDIRKTTRDEKVKLLVNDLINEDFRSMKISPTVGARENSHIRAKRMAGNLKYGPGGEGAEHKRLKEWVASNPHAIGLSNVVSVDIEHVFISGDTVDILFELPGNEYAVVEIETAFPLPGLYQALKYKVLQCAESRYDIKSSKVKAILVAWSIPSHIRNLCMDYDVQYYEIKL